MDQYVGSGHDILVQSILLHFPTICTNDILSHIPELDQYVGSIHDILVQFPYIPSLSEMCTSDILSHIPELDQSMKRHSVPKMGQNVAGPNCRWDKMSRSRIFSDILRFSLFDTCSGQSMVVVDLPLLTIDSRTGLSKHGAGLRMR
ncbi:hypothetical protein LSTR_LSTR014208 [Laodelphax striatellus]|uniref:Uncharacterized protein n=1 Tax=Laodelphax striatellus TaxID=195883 RepID=A0A482WTQ5_LAOST|nr:hypothetical protein LSTR_LSTR014208 [Laodelphax striatellus]